MNSNIVVKAFNTVNYSSSFNSLNNTLILLKVIFEYQTNKFRVVEKSLAQCHSFIPWFIYSNYDNVFGILRIFSVV